MLTTVMIVCLGVLTKTLFRLPPLENKNLNFFSTEVKFEVMPTYELELLKLQKNYGETIAVRQVDLALTEPKYCCLLGPSGCGKTSLLRMIAGHEAITAGAVLINGQDMSKKPPSLRPTSMMFQNYALFPHLKVIDNVAFALKISGMDKAALPCPYLIF